MSGNIYQNSQFETKKFKNSDSRPSEPIDQQKQMSGKHTPNVFKNIYIRAHKVGVYLDTRIHMYIYYIPRRKI